MRRGLPEVNKTRSQRHVCLVTSLLISCVVTSCEVTLHFFIRDVFAFLFVCWLLIMVCWLFYSWCVGLI
jgi:hypothetical protein